MTPQSLISATSNQEICPRWRRTRRRTYARDSSDPLLAAAFDPHATSSTRRECPRHSRWASSRGRGAFTRASRSHRRGVEPRIDVLRRRHTPLAPSSRASPHVRLPPRPIVALSGGLHPVMTTTHVVVVAHRSAWHPPRTTTTTTSRRLHPRWTRRGRPRAPRSTSHPSPRGSKRSPRRSGSTRPPPATRACSSSSSWS